MKVADTVLLFDDLWEVTGRREAWVDGEQQWICSLETPDRVAQITIIRNDTTGHVEATFAADGRTLPVFDEDLQWVNHKLRGTNGSRQVFPKPDPTQ